MLGHVRTHFYVVVVLFVVAMLTNYCCLMCRPSEKEVHRYSGTVIVVVTYGING